MLIRGDVSPYENGYERIEDEKPQNPQRIQVFEDDQGNIITSYPLQEPFDAGRLSMVDGGHVGLLSSFHFFKILLCFCISKNDYWFRMHCTAAPQFSMKASY